MKKYSKYGSLKKLLHENDLFKSPASLRVEEEPEVSQKCTGIFSMFLFLLFVYILASQLGKLQRYELIESTEYEETELDLEVPRAQGLFFSVTPAWQVYEYWARIFRVEVSLVSQAAEVYTEVEMEVCRPEQWTNFSQIYQYFQFFDNICPKNPETLAIKGANYNSNSTTYLNIRITSCTPSSSPSPSPSPNTSCLTPSELAQTLPQMYQNRQNIISLYLLDSSINSQKKQAVQKYLRMNYDFLYTNQTFSRVDIMLGTYIIETDWSVWPLGEDVGVETGYYVAEKVQSLERGMDGNGVFGDINVYMTNKRRRFVRRVGKVDQIVSFSGGLFGILVGIFAYFLNSYNEYSYELRVAESAFNYDQHGNKIKQKHFNFVKYIEFSVYDWVKFLFCFQPAWQYSTKKDSSRECANSTMDAIHLFRKLQLIDLILAHTISPNQLKLLYLTNPPTLAQVRNKRQCMEYYNAVVRGKLAINVEDIRNGSDSLGEYWRGVQRGREGVWRSVIRVGTGEGTGEGEGDKGGDKGGDGSGLFGLAGLGNTNTSNEINLDEIIITGNYSNHEKVAQQANMSSSIEQITKKLHSPSPLSSPSPSPSPSLKRQTIHKFTLYSSIADKKLIESIAEYTEIASEAAQLELYPEMLAVEGQFAQSYRQLNPEIRDKILDRIPLKILHRLVNRIQRGVLESNGIQGK